MVTQRPPRGDLNGQWLHDKAPGMKNMNTDSRPRGPSDMVEQSNTKLLVSNLHYEVTPKDLAVRSTSNFPLSARLKHHLHRPSLDRLARSFASH